MNEFTKRMGVVVLVRSSNLGVVITVSSCVVLPRKQGLIPQLSVKFERTDPGRKFAVPYRVRSTNMDVRMH